MTREQKERFKAEYAIQKTLRGGNYSYAILASQLGYAEYATSISRFLAEDREFKEYDTLAKIWHVRKEYLMCIDDFRTDVDIERAGGVKRTESIELHIKFLEMLGYTINQRLLLHLAPVRQNDGSVTSSINRDIWELIKPTLMEKALSMPINDDGSRTLADWDGEEMIPAWFTCCIPVKRTIYGSKDDGYQQVESICPNGDLEYTLEFIIYENGKPIAQMPMADLEHTFSIIDDYVRLTCSLEFDKERFEGIRDTAYSFG